MAARRILIVIETLGRGGAERLVVTTLEHLDRSRFEPFVVALSEPSDLAAEVRALGIEVHVLGMHGAGDLPRATAALRRIIRGRRIELVHTHLFFANVAGRLAARGLAPVVCTLHNPDYTHEATGSLRFHGRKLLDRFTLKWTRPRLLAVSEEVRADYLRHFGVDAQVLPNYTDVDALGARVHAVDRAGARRRLGIREGEVAVLHVGRFQRQKAQDLLVRAFHVAHRETPVLRLLLAGEGREMGRTRALAEELSLGDAVLFLGSVADPAPLYRAADVFAFPSRFEAFGLALLEAMASGLPVVATRAGGIVEVATEESALLIDIDDEIALARALVRLAGDPGLRARLGAAGAERAAAFDVRRVLPLLEAVYAET